MSSNLKPVSSIKLMVHPSKSRSKQPIDPESSDYSDSSVSSSSFASSEISRSSDSIEDSDHGFKRSKESQRVKKFSGVETAGPSTSTSHSKVMSSGGSYKRKQIDNSDSAEVNPKRKVVLTVIPEDNKAKTSVPNLKCTDCNENLSTKNSTICSRCVEKAESIQPSTSKKESPQINLKMLTELECPVCFDYMIPPIFQCIKGHSICGECKEKVTNCPVCRRVIKSTQNFVLEKMTSLLNYPCKFYVYGCSFTSKPEKIKQHQKVCTNKPQPCPINDYEHCKWSSPAKDINLHICSVHRDKILDKDTVTVLLKNDYFRNEDSRCYVKKFGDLMFKLHYRYSQNYFYWAMQLIGPPNDVKTYKFEIEICDNRHNIQKILFRSFCSSLKRKSKTFEEVGEYVFLNVKQIRCFLTDQLTYNVRILK